MLFCFMHHTVISFNRKHNTLLQVLTIECIQQYREIFVLYKEHHRNTIQSSTHCLHTLSHLVYFLNCTQSSSKSSLLGIIHLSCLSNMLSTSGRLWFWGQETRGRRSLPASSLPSPGGPGVLPRKREVRGSSPEKILKFYIAVGEF